MDFVKNLVLFTSVSTTVAYGNDQGFRYDVTTGVCKKNSSEGEIVGRNPGFLGDCGDLRNQSLQGKTIQSSLRGADLTNARLEKARLQKVDFSGAIVKGTSFAEADLSGAIFNNSTLENVDFSNAVLIDAKIHFDGRDISFRNAVMRNAFIGPKGVDQVDFKGRETVLLRADFSHADLRGARVSTVHMPRVVFQGANLSEAYFAPMDASGGDFRDATLDDAWVHGHSNGGFSNADLRGASFRGTHFGSELSFAQADLRGADFTNAEGAATWYFASYDSKARLPFDHDTAKKFYFMNLIASE